MKITLVRHGETSENAQRIIQGHLPGTLSKKGVAQAEAAAELLKDHDFDAIYCSDLKRCSQTAAILRRYHRATPYFETTELRERSCGMAEGKRYDSEYWESLPGTYETRRYPNGESWNDVRQRLIPYLNHLFQQYSEKEILLVTHGGPVRITRSLLTGALLENIDKDGTPNAGIWTCNMYNTIKT